MANFKRYPPDFRGNHLCLIRNKEKVMYSTLGTVLDELGEDKFPFEYLLYGGDFLAEK
jgi:hypothetical protein